MTDDTYTDKGMNMNNRNTNKKPRSRMPASQRAKQFAPFKSLGGDLDIALKRAEEEHRLETESKNVIHVSLEDEMQ